MATDTAASEETTVDLTDFARQLTAAKNGHAEVPIPAPTLRRLNLGAGTRCPLDGYENFDRKTGQEIAPLDGVEDGSCSEIRASHVLEHFSHHHAAGVVKHWAAKLAPGGCLKIAVPDFEALARRYLDGEPLNVQGYVLGGQTDADDFHGSLFDRENLTEVMVSAGLERIARWESDADDASALPISLNLLGYKPAHDGMPQKMTACLGAPRFGPLLHQRLAHNALGQVRVPYQIMQGCYWHQLISELMEQHLERGSEYILTLDYDSVFSPDDVRELYRLMLAYPEADAICAVQSKRHSDHALFGMVDKHGKPRTSVPTAEFHRNLTEIGGGHFGLTLFRASSLARFPRPWMVPEPNAEGRWGEGKTDADIAFWRNWRAAGLKLYLANKVVIGHLEETVVWPGKDFKPVRQSVGEYEVDGPPPEVIRDF